MIYENALKISLFYKVHVKFLLKFDLCLKKGMQHYIFLKWKVVISL